MKKINLVIDVAKCHDCNNCFMACKDEFWGNDYLPYSVSAPWHGHRWMNILRQERGQYPKVEVAYLPQPCMHCDNAPCVKECKNGEIYKRPDGIVVIDPQKAKGKKELVEACPYGAIYWNEEKAVAQKCTMCVHLLEDGWKEPKCVQVCPTGALSFHYVEDEEMEKIIAAEKLEVYHPEYQSNPRVYYKNLARFSKCFIAGSVALYATDDCAEGAKITLTNLATKESQVTTTNNYGDFKFDDLAPQSGAYTLKVEFDGYEPKVQEIDLKESLNIGTIIL